MNIGSKILWGSLVIATFFLLMPVARISAIEYGGFGGRPAYPDPDNPRTESIFVHTIAPGGIREDGVRVINNSQDTKTFLVYATDSTPSTGGAFACKQLAETQGDVGVWIKLAKSEVTIEAGKNEVVPFVVSVPEAASVGEHNGCVLVQEKKEETSASGVNISVRTGLRVAITIPGEILRNLTIRSFSHSKKDNGSIVLIPKVKNEGNVSIDANVSVVTRYFFGSEMAQHGGQYPILRGEETEWNFELSKPFWGGWYQSKLEVSYDKNPEAEVGMPSGQNLVYLEGPTLWFFSPPAPAALAVQILIVLTVLILAALRILSLRRERWIAKHWVEHKVTKAEDIQELARTHNVSWKLLAKVNDIKPPYVVEAGELIKVPPTINRKSGRNEN